MNNLYCLIKKYCLQTDLRTYDPYDIWKTEFGFRVKNFYNCHHTLGLFPAGLLTIFDMFLNNRARLFYSKHDYPIVRAFAVLTIVNLNSIEPKDEYKQAAEHHLDKLIELRCRGFKGSCWGLGWKYPVQKGLIYEANAPFTTITPYVLEAFIKYSEAFNTSDYDGIIQSILPFFEEYVKVLKETDKYLITSYGALYDRIAYNAISYSMYSSSLLVRYANEAAAKRLKEKIVKMYNYIIDGQQENGAWFYSPERRSFIDCFHSCFVLKNIIKTNTILPLKNFDLVVKKGYEYILKNFRDELTGLFKRFTATNKPGLVKYDLYDNAEVLNLGILLKDEELVNNLSDSIEKNFVKGDMIYSQIDLLGIKKNRDMLRWAVMPYIYASSSRILKNTFHASN